MNNYQFTDKFDYWKEDHFKNFNLIRDLLSKPSVLEIGILEGRTTTWILDNIPGSIITCIDKRIYEKTNYNLSYHKNRIELYLGESRKILPYLIARKSYFDFIYIDGDHNACSTLSDLIMSLQLLKIDGIMLIDDYEMDVQNPWEFNIKDYPRIRFTHPKIAIDAFLNIYRGQYEILIDNYQIGLKKLIEIESPDIYVK